MFFIRNRSLQVADQTSNVKDKTRITELECTVKLSRFISIKKHYNLIQIYLLPVSVQQTDYLKPILRSSLS